MQRVHPGQKLSGLSASDWNSLLEMAEEFRAKQNQREISSAHPRAGIVQAKNDDTIGFEQFSVVKLSDILFSPTDNLDEFKNNPAFKIKKPSQSSEIKFGILQEPVENGTSRIASVLVSGVTVVKLNVISESHTHAIPKANDHTQMDTADCGPASILWKESGTGASKWAVINLGVDCFYGSSSSISSSSTSSSSISLSSGSSSSSSSLSSPSSSSVSSSAISSSSSSSSSTSSSSSSSTSCSGPCTEVEVVTDVQCVNGNIVVTKKKLRICGTNVCVEVI